MDVKQVVERVKRIQWTPAKVLIGVVVLDVVVTQALLWKLGGRE